MLTKHFHLFVTFERKDSFHLEKALCINRILE